MRKSIGWRCDIEIYEKHPYMVEGNSRVYLYVRTDQ